MTNKNRETLQRTIGLIEGICFGANAETSAGLTVACEMLSEVLYAEEQTENE